MNGTEFIKRAKKLAKEQGIECRFEKKRGKGSHGTLYYGDKKTTVKHSEIGKGLLSAMLKQLGIKPDEF